MTQEQERCLAEVLDKRSKGDRLFAYILLIVVTFIVGIGGYNLSGLISSLSNNMDSIASDLHAMRNEMVSISHHIKSMDNSIITMSSDIHSVNVTLEGMANTVERIDHNIKYMHEDVNEMNKMNPFRKIF